MISVIIPSKLDKAPDGEFWCMKAIRSVLGQPLLVAKPILALDFGVATPEDLPTTITVTHGDVGKRSHVSAMNAALRYVQQQGPPADLVERTEVHCVAFLEDDDTWHPRRLEIGLKALTLGGADFVSCSQQEVNTTGERGRVNDFPTCSGWLVRAGLLRDLGAFDERFKIHWDNEFLGRVTKAIGKERRIHLVETGACGRPWLENIGRHSRIMETGLHEQLVTRVTHADSIMGAAAGDEERQQRSLKEYATLEILTGGIPW